MGTGTARVPTTRCEDTMRTIYVAGPEGVTVAYGTLLAPVQERTPVRVRRIVGWVLATLVSLSIMFYGMGIHAQQAEAQQQQACTPVAGETFNRCATLDTTQVQDRRTIPLPAMVPCTYEDGSGQGQVFPCLWSAAEQGNGTGLTYILLDASGSDASYVEVSVTSAN